jgi:predicted MFS family arabinose efflux permease
MFYISDNTNALEEFVPMVLSRLNGLWRNPDFMKLWVGQSISEFGSHITGNAIPLIAVLMLTVSPAELGILTAVSSLPVLLLGLFAGVWVDRLPRRPLMIACDALRLAVVLSIPFAAFTGRLTFVWICVAAALMGTLRLLFNLAYHATLPSLVERDQLLEGNTKLATTSSLMEVGGPAFAGIFIQLLTAPVAMLMDALTFVASIISVGLIRRPESPPVPAEQPNVRREIMTGLRVVFGHPLLRTLTLGIAVRSFFGSFIGTLYSLYVLEDLGLSPAMLGILISCGGIGALVGSLSAGALTRRFGIMRTLTWSLMVGALSALLIPMAGGSVWLASVIMIVNQIINDAAMAVYGVNEITLRQTLVEERFLGRANASVGFLAEGVAPVGGIISGLLAAAAGTRFTLWIAVLGILGTAIWLFVFPVREADKAVEPQLAG